MKTDARTRYTKMVIKNSFVQILQKKPFKKVTVKEICELSEINRATFYKYYCDPYDLLDKLEEEFLKELQDTIQQSTYHNFKDTFTLIMVSIKANCEIYKTLFSENGDSHFPARIFSLCYEYYGMNSDKRLQKLSSSEQSWLYYFMAQGCGGILHQWMENEMKEPISEVTDFADRLIQSTMKFLVIS